MHQHSTKVGKLSMGCKCTCLVQMASWKAGLEARIAVQQRKAEITRNILPHFPPTILC